MRCLIWAAVSSKPQASEEKDSIPSQVKAARELIQRNDGWHEVGEPLVIPGHSRSYIFLADAAADMPVYSQLMALAREGEIDLVITRGRDRLGRTDALIAQIEEYLASYNVQIYSMSMPTRVQDPQDFARRKDRASIWMRSVERARAQDEIAELQARFQMGMKRRIREGYHANRVPYGYRLNEETGIGEIYEPEAEVVKLIFSWFLQGRPYAQMLRFLPLYAHAKCPRHQNHIRWILNNPYYAGYVFFGRYDRNRPRKTGEYVMAPGKHEAIIDEETWRHVQREMAKRMEQGKRRPYTTYPLTGFVICGYCGRYMNVDSAQSAIGHQYYICRYDDCDRPTKRNSVRLDEIEEKAIAWLRERAGDPEKFQEELLALRSQDGETSREHISSLESAAKRKQAALERWRSDYEEGILSREEYYENKNRLEDELAMIISEIEEKERRMADLDPARALEQLQEIVGDTEEALRERWYSRDAAYAQKVKAFLRSLGLRITIKSDEQTTTLTG